jgi:type II secretory pathway pseudopilin PulG
MQLGFSNKQNGDTIVEVLIALAVLGSVLVGGYSIATRSINSVRVSQERGEALKIAEGQMEQLRSRLNGVSTLTETNAQFEAIFLRRDEFFVGTDTFEPQSPIAVKGFCFNVDNNATPVQTFTHDPADLASYSSTCVKSPRYHIAIVPRYKLDGANGLLSVGYTVTVRWDRSGGGDLQTLNLSYRTTLDGVNVIN